MSFFRKKPDGISLDDFLIYVGKRSNTVSKDDYAKIVEAQVFSMKITTFV